MIELIEKTSLEQREKTTRELIYNYASSNSAFERNGSIDALLQYIAKEVELAYKAGMIHFNAFEHTLNSVDSDGNKCRAKWSDRDLSFLETGRYSLLSSLYLQAKGFKK